jgi:hypothetical protein
MPSLCAGRFFVPRLLRKLVVLFAVSINNNTIMKTKLLIFFAALCFLTASSQPQISGDLLLCPNGSGTATVTNNQVYDSYKWFYKYWFTPDPFVEIPGAIGPSFTYDWMTYDQALLKVVVTLDGNTYESNTIQIDSYAWVGLTVGFEDTPNITIAPDSGTVLLCENTSFTIEVYQPYTHVQWYLNGVLILGANSMQYQVTQPGSYHVVASPDFCPDSTSDTAGLPIYVVIDTNCDLGIGQHQNEAFSVYPNPVSDMLTVSANGLTIEKLAIYNMAGQQVYVSSPGIDHADFSVSSLSAGVYILEVRSGNNLKRMKLVKQ